MRLSEFMQFIVDRCLVNNKVTLQHFYMLFEQATKKRTELENSHQPDKMSQTIVALERTIKKEEFVFLLNELGRHIYHNVANYQDRVYNDLLGDKSTA